MPAVVGWVLALASLANAQESAAAQPPQLDEREQRVLEAKQLLRDKKWQDASELFGAWPYDLSRSVQEVWRSHADNGTVDDARFRFQLLNFLFWNIDFDYPMPHDEFGRMVAGYPLLVNRLPEAERKNALDVSHGELYATVADAFHREGHVVSKEHADQVFEALAKKPNSVPMLAAFALLRQSRDGNDKKAVWLEAETLLTGDLARLTLARAVSNTFRYSSEFKLEFAERALAEGWKLSPSKQEKARLLLALAEVKSSIAKSRADAAEIMQALAVAAEVYEKSPQTRAAADARILAIHILLYGRRLQGVQDFENQSAEAFEKALALLRRLQARDPLEHAGLDQVLLDLAWNQRQRQKPEQSIEFLLELFEKHPKSAVAPQAMLRLAEAYALKGDKGRQKEWLERATRKPDTRYGVDSEAHRQLAVFHEANREWKEALSHWQAWKPSSGCGT